MKFYSVELINKENIRGLRLTLTQIQKVINMSKIFSSDPSLYAPIHIVCFFK